MKKVKSRVEMLRALHLTQTETQRLFGLSYQHAKKVFTIAMDKDRKELQERMIFEDRARMSSVLWVLGISQKDFDRIIANELKSGTAPAK